MSTITSSGSAVTSADGTRIAYTRSGAGEPLILVDGALCRREFGPNTQLAEALAGRFEVITYDRRGRGESGDAADYDVEREVEDLAALIDAVGGGAHLYGISSGAALALETAARTGSVRRLALYEAPFVVDDTRPPVPPEFAERMRELVRAGRRGDAVRYFMRVGIGLPAPIVALMRLMPPWRKLKAVAHTLPYDVALVDGLWSGRPLPPARWAQVGCPTLVAAGAKSPEWMRNAMRALADVLPDAEHRVRAPPPLPRVAGVGAVVKRRRPGPAPDEQPAGVSGIVARHPPRT